MVQILVPKNASAKVKSTAPESLSQSSLTPNHRVPPNATHRQTLFEASHPTCTPSSSHSAFISRSYKHSQNSKRASNALSLADSEDLCENKTVNKQPLCYIQRLFLPPSTRTNKGKRTGETADTSTISLMRQKPPLLRSKKAVHFFEIHGINGCLDVAAQRQSSQTNNSITNKNLNFDYQEPNSTTTTSTTTYTSPISSATFATSVADLSCVFPDAATASKESFSTVSSSPLPSTSSSLSGSFGKRSQTRPAPFRPLPSDASCDLVISNFRESINVDIITILQDLWAAIQNLSISISMVNISGLCLLNE